MDMSAYLTPVPLASAVVGLVLGGTLVVGGILNRQKLGAIMIRGCSRLFPQLGFFSLVILVFMVICVLESGQFFNEI